MKPGWNLPANPTTSKSVVQIIFIFFGLVHGASRTDLDRSGHRHRASQGATDLPRSVETPEAPFRRTDHPAFPQNDIIAFRKFGRFDP